MTTWVPMGPDVGVKRRILGWTLKLVALVTVPFGVVTAIGPVRAPLGTFVLICVSDTTVNEAETPPKVTAVAPVKFVPVTFTAWPTVPRGGVKPVMVGSAVVGVRRTAPDLPLPSVATP